jgi:hypothetical protein
MQFGHERYHHIAELGLCHKGTASATELFVVAPS